ncbi:hypothetical protein JNW90_07425 [Micromonospora sp. STR1s_5]|nr:hypothetical protein [Micromonospora sp. STR1s_5]
MNSTEHAPSVGVVGLGASARDRAGCAAAGLPVRVMDSSHAHTEAAQVRIAANVARAVEVGALSENASRAALERIQPAFSEGDFSGCGILVEAVTEDLGLKSSVYRSVCPALRSSAVVGTTSSAISITKLAAVSGCPDRFVGMHFLNPVHAIQLVGDHPCRGYRREHRKNRPLVRPRHRKDPRC